MLYELTVVDPSFDGAKPDISVNKDLSEGNIYAVMAKAESAMKQLPFLYEKRDVEEMQARVFNSGSYEAALRIIGEYVRLIVTDRDRIVIYE